MQTNTRTQKDIKNTNKHTHTQRNEKYKQAHTHIHEKCKKTHTHTQYTFIYTNSKSTLQTSAGNKLWPHFPKLLLSFHPVHFSVLCFLLSIFAVWCAQWLAGGSGVLSKYKHRSIVRPARTHPSQGQMATRPPQIKGVFAQKSDKDISHEK